MRRCRNPFLIPIAALAALTLIVAVTVAWLDRHRGIMGNLNGFRLQQIGRAIMRYSDDHAGVFPTSIADSLRAQGLDPGLSRCPESSALVSDASSTFVYVGRGLTADTADGRTVVAYAPLASAGGSGCEVLFGDGHVDWVTAADLPAVLARGGPATRPATGPAMLQSPYGRDSRTGDPDQRR